MYCHAGSRGGAKQELFFCVLGHTQVAKRSLGAY